MSDDEILTTRRNNASRASFSGVTLDHFRDNFASTAFKIIKTADGPSRKIVGKFVDIEIAGDKPCQAFDIWIVRPDREPIGTRKLNNMIRAIRSLPEYSLTGSPIIIVLDGEAYLRTTHTTLVREVGFLSGIRKRMCYSEATLQTKQAYMAKLQRISAKTAA